MNVLFIAPYAPNMIRVRAYQLIHALARRGHQLTLAAVWTSARERAALDALAAEGIRVRACHLPSWRPLLNCLRALPTGTPLQAVYCWQPALAHRLAGEIRAAGFDVAHVEHLRGARYGLQLGSQIPLVWDSVDCISHLFQQAARRCHTLRGRLIARLELERTRRYEGWLLGQFDRVLVTSEVDRQALLALPEYEGGMGRQRNEVTSGHASAPSGRRRPSAPLTVLPNGVDLEYFAPVDEPRAPAALVISGKMSYHPNVTAALHLVREIMPRVWARRPDVEVWVVGQDPPREIRALGQGGQWRVAGDRRRGGGPLPASGRVVVTGSVADIRPYLRGATLAVAPVPYGAGVQNKVLEAMACGTPVIASPQAVSALQARPGRDVAVAEGADALAGIVLALLDDAARRAQLGRAGRAYVEAHHAWDAVAARLEGIYRDTAGSVPGVGEATG